MLNDSFFKYDGYFVVRHKPTIAQIRKTIAELANGDWSASHLLLCRDDFGREWSLVFGWRHSDSGAPESECNRNGYHMEAEVGWQPYNSGMQTDIDIDWRLPISYDEDGNPGDVFDTSILITSPDDAKVAINDLWKSWMAIKRDWLKRPKL